jgi:translocation and assembly module TamB
MPFLPTSRWWRRALISGIVLALLFAASATLSWYLSSEAFGNLARAKVIAELEQVTGGRVDLHSLHWSLSRLELEANGITIHGREPANDAPLAHIAGVKIKARIRSAWRRQVDLTYLELQQPQVHLIIGRDGRTNIPEPKVRSSDDPVKQLFDLAIGRLELSEGLLLLNEQRLPLDLAANDVALSTAFDQRDRRYDATLHVGKMAAKYQDYRELPLAADAQFSAWETHAQINRLKLQSQRSWIEANGAIHSFVGPKLDFNYNGTVDLLQAAATIRNTTLRRGTATLSGSGSLDAPKFDLSGKVSAREVDYLDAGAALRGLALSTDFHADNAGTQLTHLAGRALGGEVSGGVEMKNTTPSTGQAQLRVAGLSLVEISRAFSSRALPLDKFRLAGSTGGTVNYSWNGAPSSGRAEFALDFAPPSRLEPGWLAPSGTARGVYQARSGLLELRPLQLATAATKLDASGQIGARWATLQVSLATRDLNEIEGVLSAVGQPSLPLDLGGAASFTGTVAGSLRAPEVKGHLSATDFTYLYASPPAAAGNASVASSPPPPAHPRRIHFDSFTGDILYSRTQASLQHAVIRRAEATLTLAATAGLRDGAFTDDSTFELQLAVKDGDAARFQQMIGTDYPVTGKINLRGSASGTRANPNGHATVVLKNLTAWGRSLDSLSTDVSLHNHELALANVKLKAPGGTAQGSGAYNLNTRYLQADFRSDNIQLARVPELQLERLTTAGAASITVHASGTPQQPILDANLRVAKLVLNQEHVGDLTLNAKTQGETMTITGRSDFEHATLMLDGTVQMRDQLPGRFDIVFNNLDIDPFLSSEIKGRITAHSAVAGTAHIIGPLRRPEALTGTLKIDEFHTEIEKVPLRSDGPIELALAGQKLSIASFAMISQDSRLQVHGDILLDGQRALNLQADGSVNAALFQTFDPDLTSSGQAIVNLRVEGTAEHPVMQGRVDIAHLSLSNIDLPAALNDTSGSLIFNQSRLEIEKLTGKIGGGKVEFTGYIGYTNGINFNISSQGSDIRFRYAGISLTADQSLKLQGTLKNATASGDITITRFAQIPSADLAAALANASPPIPNAASPLNNLHLDIHIRSTPDLTVQTTLAKLSGDADLRVRGTALNPVLLGHVNMAQGDIKINGQKFFLERADITFSNPVRLDPILDVEATTRVRDFDITIGLHGTLERLQTTYRSDPPLSSEDILSLLAFGRTQQESALGSASGSGAGFGEIGGSALVGAAINQAVSSRVSRLFGVSAIRINPAAGGPDNNPNARLTVEQQVSSNVTITYITNLSRSAQQVLQFEYNVTRDYTISAVRDENGVVSFDLLIRKRKK